MPRGGSAFATHSRNSGTVRKGGRGGRVGVGREISEVFGATAESPQIPCFSLLAWRRVMLLVLARSAAPACRGLSQLSFVVAFVLLLSAVPLALCANEIPLVTRDSKGRISAHPAGLEFLASIEGPLAVVVVSGGAGSG